MSTDIFQYTVWVRQKMVVTTEGHEKVVWSWWRPVITTMKREATCAAQAFARMNPNREYRIIIQGLRPEDNINEEIKATAAQPQV